MAILLWHWVTQDLLKGRALERVRLQGEGGKRGERGNGRGGREGGGEGGRKRVDERGGRQRGDYTFE